MLSQLRQYKVAVPNHKQRYECRFNAARKPDTSSAYSA